MRVGLVCPYYLGRPRRRAGAHQGPRRGADRARPRGLGDRPGRRRRRPARLRRPGRPGRRRFPTTARCARLAFGLRCPPAGCAAGSRTATSTCCTCTSPPRPACRCWPAGSPTGRSWRPCTRRCRGRVPCTRPQPILASALEKISGRIAVSEAARTTLVEHLGGDAVLIPNGVTVRRYEKAEPLPGWPGDGRRARLPRPDGRAAQGPGRAAGARSRSSAPSGPGCGC